MVERLRRRKIAAKSSPTDTVWPPRAREIPRQTVDLSSYRNPPTHDKGRSFLVRAIWHCVNALRSCFSVLKNQRAS